MSDTAEHYVWLHSRADSEGIVDLRAAVLDMLKAVGRDHEKERGVLYAPPTGFVVPELDSGVRPITLDGLWSRARFLFARVTSGLLRPRGVLEAECADTTRQWIAGAGPSLEAAALTAMQAHIAQFRADPSDDGAERVLKAAREFSAMDSYSLDHVNADKRKAVYELYDIASLCTEPSYRSGPAQDARLSWGRAWFAAKLIRDLRAYTVAVIPRTAQPTAGTAHRARFWVLPVQLCMFVPPKW